MQSSLDLPVSRIKVRVPFRRRELITRTRLIDTLYEQLDKRLLLIVAPAGYGKTSLLVDFAQQSEMAVCWLSLDSLDQEPQRFLRYWIASIAERFPDFGRDSLAALESMSSFEEDEERLLVTLANEVNAQIHDHFTLILDDYQQVANVQPIAHIISRFLQLCGENVHIILASRNLPDLPDAPLMIARNQVGGLSFEELTFVPQEIQQLFQQNNGITLSQQDAEKLIDDTEGWIAAIHLTNGHPKNLPRLHPHESTRELFDFFSREVLLQQPEQVRRFLLITSVFDTFDVELCRQVLEPLLEEEQLDWQTLFDIVLGGNLFSIPFDSEGRWMRYHHLFQHFLRSQLQYEQPTLAWHIQQNLARAYEQQQAWEEALQLYAKMDDQENLVRLLIHTGAIFIAAGWILTLSNWLSKLPQDVLYSQPALISLLGIVHTSKGDNRHALELLDLAESRLRDTGNDEDWTATLVRRAEVNRQLGYFNKAIDDAETILELTKDSSLPTMQFTYAEAKRIKGLALVGLGHLQESLVWLQDALQTCRTLGIQKSIPILETELGVVYRRLGQPEVTAQYYARALNALENQGNTGWKARLLNNMGLLHHMTGKLDEAFPLLVDALKVAERSGYTRIQTNVMISLGDLLTDLCALDLAYDYYDKALTLATQLGNSLYIFYASLGEARLKRLAGEALSAAKELRQVELSQVHMGIYERALFNLELGCCWLESNKLEPAIVILRDAVSLFKEGGNPMEQGLAELWLEVAASIKFPDVAIVNTKELLPPERQWQTPTPLMIHAIRAGRWLKRRGSTQLFKDVMLSRFFDQAERIYQSLPILYRSLVAGPQDVHPESPRLEIRSFGNVQLLHNQRPIGISDWQTREARDLFFFLLHSPPLTKEQIGVEFWPEISTARLKMRFKINIYRIRQAIGPDSVVFENERYRFNRSIPYSWDRENLDELLRALQQVDGPDKIKLLEQIMGLLKGPYMADLDAEWAISDRLKYQDIHQDLMIELAKLYLTNDQARACLNMARLVLKTDPLLEMAHRLIIQAYATLRDPAGMALQYREYRQILKEELGLQPSSELSALYNQLLAAI